MKTRYRFIHFERTLMDDWSCRNNKSGALLGTVEYWAPWKQHVFSASERGCVFSADCLADIARFLADADAERKADTEAERKTQWQTTNE